MPVKEQIAKSIIRKHKRIDSWFISRFGMNLYRGCSHNCVYCDGRSEGYYVEGDFGKDIVVKTNAPEIVRRELDPARKRKPYPGGFIMIGGGVCDAYQPVEEKYRITRQILKIIHEFGYPVHILTKSTLVKRDIDLIRDICNQSAAIVSFSLSSTDQEISGIFEAGVPSPAERLKTIEYFRSQGIPCGVFLLPVLPFISDTNEQLESSVKDIISAGANFIIFGGLTLKIGQQKDFYYESLRQAYPHLVSEYNRIYKGKKWGEATGEYSHKLHNSFYRIWKENKIPVRIPSEFFKETLRLNDLVTVMFEHMDYILKLEGKSSPFGYAAYSISRLAHPLTKHTGNLQSISGIGSYTEKIIKEIIQTGTSSYYNELFYG